MKVLVACEYSGTVRDAFIKKGHTAISCDLLPTDVPGSHYQGDVFDIINDGWDLMIAHPPCTYLCASGARWWAGLKNNEQESAVIFFMALYNVPIPMIAIENPVGIMSTLFRTPDQYVQPWMFGHEETKKTGLWLKGLPPLLPTDVRMQRKPVCHYLSPSPDRWKLRSKTYQGIASAMANQWG